MKRIGFAWTVALMAVLVAIVAPFVYNYKKQENLYPAVMEVVSIENDLVTVQTSTGIAYQFEGAQDLAVGDLAGLIMDDNNTDIVYDDIIVKVRYGGYWLE